MEFLTPLKLPNNQLKHIEQMDNGIMRYTI